jgi:hypothetical protein
MIADVVLVIWDDVCANSLWSTEVLTPVSCYAVGIVVEDNDSFLTLAGGIAQDDDYLTQISIPKGIIRKIKKLTKINTDDLHEL